MKKPRPDLADLKPQPSVRPADPELLRDRWTEFDARTRPAEFRLAEEPQRPTQYESVLLQRYWYMAQSGAWQRVPEMTPVESLKAATRLLEMAHVLHSHDVRSAISFAGTLNGEMAQDEADSVIDELENTDPLDWMRDQPLWKALIKRGRKAR